MLCQHCNKDIPEENLQIHEVNCRRNNVKCDKCQEIIPKSSFEEHVQEMHELKQCQNCEKEFEKQFFSAHQCADPDSTCKYCEAILKSSLMPEHLLNCENQTEECFKCHKYIKKKDIENHQKINCLNVAAPMPPPLPPPPLANPLYLPSFNNFQAIIPIPNLNQIFNPDMFYFQNSDFNIPNAPPVIIPDPNNAEIQQELEKINFDNLKGYNDDGGKDLKGKLTVLKGPRFSVLNRPRLRPVNRRLISSEQDYQELNNLKPK